MATVPSGGRHANLSSTEWYTPPEVIEAVKMAMGGIDLDPASCAAAQEIVKARRYFTAEEDGLRQDWTASTLWLNPPYLRGVVDDWADKLIEEFVTARVRRAIWLSNNSTDTQWFQRLSKRAGAIFLPSGRFSFIRPEGKSKKPVQGQVLLHFGQPEQSVDFVRIFGRKIGGSGFFQHQ